MKKVLLTVILLVVAGMLAFLMFSDPGPDTALQIDVPQGTTTPEPVKDKSQLISEARRREQEKELEQRLSQKRKEEARLDFNSLFREDKNPDPGRSSDTSKAHPATVKPSNPSAAPKVVYARKTKSGKQTATATSPDPEENSTGDISFSTIETNIQDKPTAHATIKSGSLTTKTIENVAKIAIYGDYALKPSMKVEFVLLEPLVVNGVALPSNTIFTAYVRAIGQRISFRIPSIKNVIHPFEILDMDYESGIYNSAYVDETGKIGRNTSENIESDVVLESGINEYMIAQEIISGARRASQKKTQHEAFLETGKKYYLKY